jgi:hypothetical protein
LFDAKPIPDLQVPPRVPIPANANPALATLGAADQLHVLN